MKHQKAGRNFFFEFMQLDGVFYLAADLIEFGRNLQNQFHILLCGSGDVV